MRIFAPLRERPIALLWSALTFSALGDQLNLVALNWIAVDVMGPAAGYFSAGKAGVIIFTALAGGHIADRWDRRRTMVAADLCRCATLLVLVAAWLTQGRPPAWALAAAVLVLAAGEAFFEPALQTVLPVLVKEPRLLVATNGLLDATDRLARLLGPGLIVFVGALVAPVHFFTLDAVSFLVSAVAVAMLRMPLGRPAPATTDRGSVRESLVRGFRALWRKKLLGYLLCVGGVVNGVWYAVFFLAVPLAISDRLGHANASGLGVYGLTFSCYGVSNLAANLVVGSRSMPERPAGQIFSGTCLTGLGIALMALACTPLVPASLQIWAFAASAAVSGFGGPLKDIPLATLRQMHIASGDMASAMRANLIVSSSGLLIAMLVAAPACAALGPVRVMLIGAGAYLTVSLAGWARFSRSEENRAGPMPGLGDRR